MPLLKLIIKSILFSTLFLACSPPPVPIPINFHSNEEIRIESEEIRKLAQEIYKLMKNQDMGPKAVCSTPLANWLKQIFTTNGRIPKKLVSPIDYGVDATDSYKCKSFDTEKEFKDAARKAIAGNLKAKGHMFDGLKGLKAEVEKGGMIADFFNNDKRKIEITGMSVRVLENSLNVTTDSYTIYLTTKESGVDLERLEQPDAEKTLLEEGKIFYLGKTQKIRPGQTGLMPIELIANFDDLEIARKMINSLDSIIILMPPKFNENPDIATIAGEDFYIVPRGSAKLSLGVSLLVKFEFSDLMSEWDRQKEKIQKRKEKLSKTPENNKP